MERSTATDQALEEPPRRTRLAVPLVWFCLVTSSLTLAAWIIFRLFYCWAHHSPGEIHLTCYLHFVSLVIALAGGVPLRGVWGTAQVTTWVWITYTVTLTLFLSLGPFSLWP
jgi:hypothetical protein